MIFGIPVTGTMLLIAGGSLFVLLLFQVLLGLRVIKLGRRHRTVHRWVAYTIVGLAALHGVFGVLFVTGTRIG